VNEPVVPNIALTQLSSIQDLGSPTSDTVTDFLSTLAEGRANILFLDKVLTKGASDSAYLLVFIQKLAQVVTTSSEGRENTVSFLMGKYGVSMMNRLLLMIDYDSDWGEAASEGLDQVRRGLTDYNFDTLKALLRDDAVTVEMFAHQAHAKTTLTSDQKSKLAEAFVTRHDVSVDGVVAVLFENSKQPMDFDLRMAIMRQYAQKELGLEFLLANTNKGVAADVLLMGLSQNTLHDSGRSFELARQWISGENGASILKAMYVKKSEETQLLMRMLGSSQQTGRDALVVIGTGLVQSMAQGTDQGLATKGLVRDIIVATEPIPAAGALGDILLQQTVSAGHFSGDVLKETVLLNGLGKDVPFGDLLEKMVTAGQAICVGKDPVVYEVVRDDNLVATLEALAVDTYGVSVGKLPRVVDAIVQRLNLRPIYESLVSFMATDLNFLLKNGGYTWISGHTEGAVNPFLVALDQRLEALLKQAPAKVIGSSGRKKYEKIDKKESRRPSLSAELREAYISVFDSFESGKISFAELMQVLARQQNPKGASPLKKN